MRCRRRCVRPTWRRAWCGREPHPGPCPRLNSRISSSPSTRAGARWRGRPASSSTSVKRMSGWLRAAALVLIAWIAGAAAAQTVDHAQHRFGGAEKWAQVLDDPARDAWQKPHEVLQALKLAPDASVADIGSGTGYFAVRLAHRVPNGRVYGVDAEPDMVRYLAERAKREGLANLT